MRADVGARASSRRAGCAPRSARRVADHARAAADERDRPAAEALELEQPEDRHEMADVERVGGRIEADVGGDRAARASRAGSPGVVACEDARASRARRGGPSSRPASAPPAVTARARRVVSTQREAARTVRSRSLCYRAATDADQPRAAPAPSTGAPAAAPGAAVDRSIRRILVVILDHPSSLARPRCRRAAVSSVRRGRVQLLRQGLPDPRPRSRTSSSSSSRVIYDRTGKIELARFGELKREVVTFDQLPGRCSTRRPRSRTRTSGPTRASTRRHRRRPASTRSAGRPRGASTITQQLVRARLLRPSRVRGHHLRAQDPGDHPVDPRDPGVSRARTASRRSSPPTSTRTSTATTATA